MKHLAPAPRLKIGQAIGERGLATAMIDVSDGLSTDLWHVLDESDCGAIIKADTIPVAGCVQRLATGDSEIEPLRLALDGGEEYELLFTSPLENQNRIAEMSEEFGVPITAIGQIVADKGLRLERDGSLRSNSAFRIRAYDLAVLLLSVQHFVFVEKRGAHTSSSLIGSVPEFFERVTRLARHVDSVACRDLALFVAYLHHTATGKDVVNLFNFAVVMRRDCLSGQKRFFGQAAPGYFRCRAVYQRANLRPVTSVNYVRIVSIHDFH